ncbi:MAG TPA: phage tail protein [Candidatus Limnocylindria bacterium]|jgi:phage tail-like protein|nr:phage tail protein [Candidatus Limnocylindria bacterium]
MTFLAVAPPDRWDPLAESLASPIPLSPITGRPELLAPLLGEPLSSDPFLRRLLAIFEPALWPVVETLDSFAAYLDPYTTSEEFLRWLASWLDLALDETWESDRRRRLVASAVVMYRWRGTKRGMLEYLTAYLGTVPEVIDEAERVEVADEPLVGGEPIAPMFRVIVNGPAPEAELSRLRAIVELAKPAHAGYRIEVRTRRARS